MSKQGKGEGVHEENCREDVNSVHVHSLQNYLLQVVLEAVTIAHLGLQSLSWDEPIQ